MASNRHDGSYHQRSWLEQVHRSRSFFFSFLRIRLIRKIINHNTHPIINGIRYPVDAMGWYHHLSLSVPIISGSRTRSRTRSRSSFPFSITRRTTYGFTAAIASSSLFLTRLVPIIIIKNVLT